MKKLHRHHLGQIGQLKVEIRAAEKGFTTNIPSIPVRYDILLDSGKEIFRAQIKYCNNFQSKNQLILSLERKHLNQKKYNKHDIDLLLVYLPYLDKILAFPPKLFHNRPRIYINVKNPNSKIYWKKYEW